MKLVWLAGWLQTPGMARSYLDAVGSAFTRGLTTLLTAGLTVATASVLGLETTQFTTRDAVFALDEQGALRSITRRNDGRNYLAAGQPAPLVSVRIAGKLYAPVASTWDAPSRRLTCRYRESDAIVVLQITSKTTHLVLEAIEVEPREKIELILWGPYPTSIQETVGEVIGVVRDGQFAVGIQALNAKTLGGYPTQENDIEADYTADDTGRYPDLPEELKLGQLFRGDTARRTEYGSVLQAYCRNRDRDRIIANWGHDEYLAPAFKDGGVIGSKIALFACPAAQALETIGAIELAEGLPHPMLDGVWAKVAPNANSSYLIVDFSEATLDRAVEMTKRAGLNYLYHSSPFETWGHFRLKPDLFPNGWDGLRACVEKARRAGVRIGFHTLSNFITPNDAYVTPKPDPRLARIGASVLTGGVDAEQTEIAVAAPGSFRKSTPMNTVMIGEELIRYGSVSAEAPWRLLDCQRGAWGTAARPHAEGASVAKLMDHEYRVFLTDASLTMEVARHLARLCNHAGTRQISLDGLEGAWSTGMGQYGRTLFAQTWYESLAPELRGQINDASNPGHFNWHSYTRMNWGEPWYAGFRESQTLYRFKNQLHFERNLMPRMLGWFALRPDTSLEDAEWLLARAAGFGAGFALAASLASTAQLAADPSSADAARQFGATPAILAAIRQWESARLAQAFPSEVRAALRDNHREFHLQPVDAHTWDLFEVHTARFSHDAAQPEPTRVSFRPSSAQRAVHWTLRSSTNQPMTGVSLAFNGRQVIDLRDRALPPGATLCYRGGPEAVLCDLNWKEMERLAVASDATQVSAQDQELAFGCSRQNAATLKLELRTFGPARRISAAPDRRP
jgi:hypothetical protein